MITVGSILEGREARDVTVPRGLRAALKTVGVIDAEVTDEVGDLILMAIDTNPGVAMLALAIAGAVHACAPREGGE